jgi:undecaprenyl-diphosphatase
VRTAASLAVLVACFVLLAVVAVGAHDRGPGVLDSVATSVLHGLATPRLDGVMDVITALGSTPVVATLVVVTFALLWWRRHRREALFLAVAIIGSLLIDESLKLLVHRPRPQLEWAALQSGYSFPSGHAMNSLVFYSVVAIIIWATRGRRAGRVALGAAAVLALLIGTSRIYLGYHYLTDVVGGFLAGSAWLLALVVVFGGRAWLGERSGDDGSVPV